MSAKNIRNWINELANEKPIKFGEFFYDDIRNYLNFSECADSDLESSMKKVCRAKYSELISCQSKDDVKKWLNKISGNIIMDIDTESIIQKYFN